MANALLRLSNISILIKDVKECTSSFFVAIFEALANERVDERLSSNSGLKIHRRPVNIYHHIDNVFAVLFCLHIQFPWIVWWKLHGEDDKNDILYQQSADSELKNMYKTAEAIVHGDKNVIMWLVSRFYDIAVAKDESYLSKLAESKNILLFI